MFPGDGHQGYLQETAQNFGVWSPGRMGESGVQNRDERCRTMKGQVGGVLEELDNETAVKALEKSRNETVAPKSGEPKQLNQTRSW